MKVHRRGIAIAVALVAALVLPAGAGAAKAPRLVAGAGRADITPPQTGYFLGGFTRADRLALGQSTRLFANTIVLQRGATKVALVAVELFAVPAGLQEDVAREVADLGLDHTTILMAASHTHSGPGGYANNPTYNTAAPSVETVTDPMTFVELLDPKPADRRLYTFLVHQIAQSIRRADADRAPAAVAWGHTTLEGVTVNRSIEAHLADHGIHLPYGDGLPQMDPDGITHTIDPDVEVLRVDKLERRRGRTVHVPIGGWSNFADHGTVVKAQWQAYGGDHHAAAARVFSDLVRRAGNVPAGQLVVNVYPNGDEGDQSAGLTHTGPSGADEVGRDEAYAMFRAWKAAGRAMSATPALEQRWTRTCFCGRETATGHVAATGRAGLPFLTGSEEERGPLFDLTRTPFEGVTSPVDDPDQGDKVTIPVGSFPPAVPLTLLRIGDGAIASFPGEPTKEVGARTKRAVLGVMAPAGVRRVMIAGLANDYAQYFTTPEEYGRQHYEGGSTLYGPNTSTFLQERLTELARDLVGGQPAPAPYKLDTSYGVKPDGPGYPAGAASGTITAQPGDRYARLQRARLSWRGGPDGHDRPLDAAFVTAERRVDGAGWQRVDDDLGLDMLWRVDGSGRYDLQWEIPLAAPAGTYRFVVTATRYRLESSAFEVVPTATLTATPVETAPGRLAVRLTYPPANPDVDLTSRPPAAQGGVVRFRVDGRTVRVRRRHGTTFSVAAPAGTTVSIPAGAASDTAGNTTGRGVSLG